MPLWLDKYAPKSLEKLDFNRDLHNQIKNLIDSGNFPHLLLYGPSGSGKKTRIRCILKMLYGNSVSKLRLENYNYQTPSKKKLEIATISSNFHLEVNPTDAGIYDRLIVQDLIKQVASTVQLDQTQKNSFKVVVLHDVDRLTREAQHALRRTMEKFVSTCRLILCCESTSRIISPTLSRCLLIRVRAPSEDEIVDILRMICKKESLEMPMELARKIASLSDMNLRRAILMAEVARVQQTPMKPDQNIAEPDWKVFISMTAKMILAEQSPKKVLEVRGRLYDLLSHCIPPDVIIKEIVENLFKVCDHKIKLKLLKLAGEYEFRMKQGSKPIYHLEAFVVGFMAMYKKHVEENVRK